MEKQIGIQLALILRLKRRRHDLQMKEIGLCRTQWQALCWLNHLGPCSQKTLLQHMDVDAAHLARTLDECERRGYLLRRPCKQDRRSLWVELTEEAKTKLIPHLVRVGEAEQARMLKGLTEAEKKSFQSLLDRIESNLKEPGDDHE